MSTNKFLQRFEGKIQVVGKQGVQNVFGGKEQPVPVYTNNNFNQQNKNKTSTSLNKNKPVQEKPKQVIESQKKVPKPLANEQPNKKQSNKAPLPPQNKQKKIQVNPFLISNPFYLDEEDKQKLQKERKERELQEKLQLQREKQRQRQLIRLQQKNTTGALNKSLDKKKLTEKQWTKLGGLGANIGGQQWMKKKQKLDKMQQFSQQVKQINKDKPKIPKNQKRQQKSQSNPRQKALQYSKNVPRPVVRVVQSQREQGHEQQQQIIQQQLTQLQLYELKHEQYKNMLKNQL